MPAIARFYPAIFSAIALLGCVLPFGTGGAGPGEANLLDFPSAMSQLGKLSSIFNPSDSSVSTGTASLIASLVYIVPVLAIVIIVLNFRGTVEKTLQLFTAIAWLLAIFFVPYFAILSLINSNPLLRGLSDLSGGAQLQGNFGIGGWLIFMAAVGLSLASIGILKFEAVGKRA